MCFQIICKGRRTGHIYKIWSDAAAFFVSAAFVHPYCSRARVTIIRISFFRFLRKMSVPADKSEMVECIQGKDNSL